MRMFVAQLPTRFALVSRSKRFRVSSATVDVGDTDGAVVVLGIGGNAKVDESEGWGFLLRESERGKEEEADKKFENEKWGGVLPHW